MACMNDQIGAVVVLLNIELLLLLLVLLLQLLLLLLGGFFRRRCFVLRRCIGRRSCLLLRRFRLILADVVAGAVDVDIVVVARGGRVVGVAAFLSGVVLLVAVHVENFFRRIFNDSVGRLHDVDDAHGLGVRGRRRGLLDGDVLASASLWRGRDIPIRRPEVDADHDFVAGSEHFFVSDLRRDMRVDHREVVFSAVRRSADNVQASVLLLPLRDGLLDDDVVVDEIAALRLFGLRLLGRRRRWDKRRLLSHLPQGSLVRLFRQLLLLSGRSLGSASPGLSRRRNWRQRESVVDDDRR